MLILTFVQVGISAYLRVAYFNYVLYVINVIIWTTLTYLIKQEHICFQQTSKSFREMVVFPLFYVGIEILIYHVWSNPSDYLFLCLWVELIILLLFNNYLIAKPYNYQVKDIQKHIDQRIAASPPQSQVAQIPINNEIKQSIEPSSPQFPIPYEALTNNEQQPEYCNFLFRSNQSNNRSEQFTDNITITYERMGNQELRSIHYEDIRIFIRTIKIRFGCHIMQALDEQAKQDYSKILMKNILKTISRDIDIQTQFGLFLEAESSTKWANKFIAQYRKALDSFAPYNNNSLTENLLESSRSSNTIRSQNSQRQINLISIRFNEQTVEYTMNQRYYQQTYYQMGIDEQWAMKLKKQIEYQLSGQITSP